MLISVLGGLPTGGPAECSADQCAQVFRSLREQSERSVVHPPTPAGCGGRLRSVKKRVNRTRHLVVEALGADALIDVLQH